MGDVLGSLGKTSHTILEKGREEVGLFHVIQTNPLKHGPRLVPFKDVPLAKKLRPGSELDQEVQDNLLKTGPFQLEQIVCDQNKTPDVHLFSKLFTNLPRQTFNSVLAVLDATTGDEAETVFDIMLDKQPAVVDGYAAHAVVKGGAILCHGAEQRRTTGRSVFSMSVTLRWASAEDLSGIERGAV